MGTDPAANSKIPGTGLSPILSLKVTNMRVVRAWYPACGDYYPNHRTIEITSG